MTAGAGAPPVRVRSASCGRSGWGGGPPAEASATKIYGSELATEVYRSLMEIVGPNAGVTADSVAILVWPIAW